jgi:nitroreductase
METWDALRARRNVRQYTDRPIPAADLDRILEAGRRAPSSKNGQPWDFVVVTDRPTLVALAEVWTYAGHIAASAATIALVSPVMDAGPLRDAVQFDLGQVVMAMAVTAADLGVGTGHSAVGDQALARDLLGLPADRECDYLLALGYPADRPLRPIVNPTRRPFDDVVHRDGW